VGATLNLPWRKGARQRTELSVNKHSNKPHPKAGQVVDHRVDLLNQRAAFKTKLPHLAGRGADQKAAAEG
jgi:hypothetical protein